MARSRHTRGTPDGGRWRQQEHAPAPDAVNLADADRDVEDAATCARDELGRFISHPEFVVRCEAATRADGDDLEAFSRDPEWIVRYTVALRTDDERVIEWMKGDEDRRVRSVLLGHPDLSAEDNAELMADPQVRAIADSFARLASIAA